MCQKSLTEFATHDGNYSPCSAGACTWRNILYRLQVWNLSPGGGQIMRAAGCENLSESPEGVFRQSESLRLMKSRRLFSMYYVQFCPLAFR